MNNPYQVVYTEYIPTTIAISRFTAFQIQNIFCNISGCYGNLAFNFMPTTSIFIQAQFLMCKLAKCKIVSKHLGLPSINSEPVMGNLLHFSVLDKQQYPHETIICCNVFLQCLWHIDVARSAIFNSQEKHIKQQYVMSP